MEITPSVLKRASAATVASILCAAAAMVGCTSEPDLISAGGPLVRAPDDTVSVYQLAGRLGLRVTDSGTACAILRNPANVVTIYADPGGQAYVNGRAVAGSGGIVPVAGMLFVPDTLEAVVQSAMRPLPLPTVAPEPNVPTKPEMPILGKVVLDPGHGGKDPGAVNSRGQREKNIVLPVALAAARQLRSRGVDVTLTRHDDSFIELNERAAIANRLGADLFVSLHADSARNRSARGFTVYIARSAAPAAGAVAKIIARRLSHVNANSRGVRRASYRVLVRTSCPAVLVELGYLSNRADAANLSDRGHRLRLSKAVCEAIVEFLAGR